MFEPSERPRVFGVPPGADFPQSVADALMRHFTTHPPEALAKVHIFANAGRMKRRLIMALTDGAPRLLPRISLVSDLASLVPNAGLPVPQPPLERTLEMARLLTPLLESADAPAPRSAIFDIADSLIALLDEAHTEGVPVGEIARLDIEGTPRHWERTQQFLGVVDKYLDATRDQSMDSAALQRAALKHLLERWGHSPPQTPVLIVGSTGSRGTTFELMRAVAQLPQGAVVLPGFDFDAPQSVWDRLTSDDPPPEDHAQFRFASFLMACGLTQHEVQEWPGEATDPDRNKLISLSLRPAPATDQWRTDGPSLGDLVAATKGLSLIQAAQPKDEATAIAVAARDAVENGHSVAIITPDRTLSRRATAALARWAIVPDDSAGMPLSLSPPGRLLRQITRMMGAEISPSDFIALLRHPLVRTGGADRGDHLLLTDALDIAFRRAALPAVDPDIVTKQGKKSSNAEAWAQWIKGVLHAFPQSQKATLHEFADRTVALSEMLSRGSSEAGAGTLWDKEAGEKARDHIDRLRSTSSCSQVVTLADYRRLLDHVLEGDTVRAGEESRSDVAILGTLEARTQSADLVILGGLNEGVWPGMVAADPWLSRTMRRAAGLMSPDRQIGLSAHDYQQAVAGQRVILSHALRDEEAETVPSRWLNRLVNLLDGLPEQGGPDALKAMKDRGSIYLDHATALDMPDTPVDAAPRPAPAPPVDVRPKQLSVTEIEKMIRDPYWVYAKHVLRLRPLDRLEPQPDSRLRGQVFHKVVERFIDAIRDDGAPISGDHFLSVARVTLDELVPWNSTREMWMGHLSRIATDFVSQERLRQNTAKNMRTEAKGRLKLSSVDFVITGEADRIDATPDGGLIIYDYKAGPIPSHKQARVFHPQILIEAVMAEASAFEGIPGTFVKRGAYLSFGRGGNVTDIPMDEYVITHGPARGEVLDFKVATVAQELEALLEAYAQHNLGYAARRAMEKVRFEGDYDHLARFGEWDDAVDVVRISLP